MNIELQHTPTPWHRNVSPAYKYPIFADKNGDAKGRDWIHIAAVLSGNPNQEADLDFIIRAVNSHEALLEALKAAKNLLDEQAIDDGHHAEYTMIEQAVAKAEGK